MERGYTNRAKVGVGGSNPLARSKFIYVEGASLCGGLTGCGF